jgi:hypothetical protein
VIGPSSDASAQRLGLRRLDAALGVGGQIPLQQDKYPKTTRSAGADPARGISAATGNEGNLGLRGCSSASRGEPLQQEENMADAKPLAVVTGASSGIGAAYARALAARGYDLALVARRRDRLQQLAEELASRHHANCTVLAADLANEAELRKIEELLAGAANLELLVNNAGFGSMGRFFEAPVESQDAMHRLHVLATLRLTHAALRNLTARNTGAIVNVASVAAFVPRPGSTSYYATKAWINCFTEGLYLELKAAGSRVRVQALCPGFTVTEFHDVLGLDREEVFGGAWWMKAEDVVEASLHGLEKGKLFVVPGLRYKLLVGLLRLLPRGVLHFAVVRGPASIRRDRRPARPA